MVEPVEGAADTAGAVTPMSSAATATAEPNTRFERTPRTPNVDHSSPSERYPV